MTEADLYRFLAESTLAVLGSVAKDGTPQSALVGFAVTADLEIVFDTVKSSRKYANLIASPACSFVIGWKGERTVQYEGVAEECGGEECEGYKEVYFRAWPECAAHQSWPGIVYFVVRPVWIRYSDFERSPALIREFDFRGGVMRPA